MVNLEAMTDKEQLLHYVWKCRLLPACSLVTVDGQKIEVIDTGIHNMDAGPDFFNAKIRIAATLWVGNVEIHRTSADWVKHGHHLDKAYNSVILHLSEKVDRVVVNERGQTIPQCEMTVPENVRRNADYLLYSDSPLPCKSHLSSLPGVIIHAYLSQLSMERLERKVNDIFRHLDRFRNSWDDVFYVLLTRNFGFGLNAEVFEKMALSLPFTYIRKQSDNLFQVEALLFGQAGMLEDPHLNDTYYQQLRAEYHFLQSKYTLKNREGYLFKKMRVRPSSSPHLRIAQLAALLQNGDRLFSSILEQEEYGQWIALFQAEPSCYWHTHYSFGKEAPKAEKPIGEASLNIILINTVAPLLFAYGKRTASERFCERAVKLLESLKPERNKIIGEFSGAGVTPQNALDSQALIQLRKEYCDQRKCLYCRIGHTILSSR